jgi:hypothetical protein
MNIEPEHAAIVVGLITNSVVMVKLLLAQPLQRQAQQDAQDERVEARQDKQYFGLSAEVDQLRLAEVQVRKSHLDEIARLDARVTALETALFTSQRQLLAAYRYIALLVKTMGAGGVPVPLEENGRTST